MTDNYQNLRCFFSTLELTITREEHSGSFGDYILEGCNFHFCLRAVCDRSFESIEVRAENDTSEWFILNLVMSYVLREDRLVQEISLEESMEFLQTHRDVIASIFADDNYEETESELKKLAHQRGKRLFPKWFC